MPTGEHIDETVEDAIEYIRKAEQERAEARTLRAEADTLDAKADDEERKAECNLAEARTHDGKLGGRLTILVNGREKEVESGPLSYERIIELAFGSSAGAASQTVTWRRRDGEEGSLLPGEHVRAHEGMIFTATATNRS